MKPIEGVKLSEIVDKAEQDIAGERVEAAVRIVREHLDRRDRAVKKLEAAKKDVSVLEAAIVKMKQEDWDALPEETRAEYQDIRYSGSAINVSVWNPRR